MDAELIIPLAGIMLPLILVPTIIALVHRHKRREWRHQEQLRAIEMGLPAPATERALGGATVAAIGAGVPVAAVLTAWLTTMSVPHSKYDYMAIVAVSWGCAFLISLFALITSLVLAILLIRSSNPAQPVNQFAANKPAYDPDAFDVVSSRG